MDIGEPVRIHEIEPDQFPYEGEEIAEDQPEIPLPEEVEVGVEEAP